MTHVELGGKKRQLHFDLNAMVAYEEKTGKQITDWKEGYTPNLSEIRVLTWASLLTEDSDLTIEEVGSWIGLQNINVTVDKVMEVIMQSLPETKGELKNKRRP